jgi:hypothetical protein
MTIAWHLRRLQTLLMHVKKLEVKTVEIYLDLRAKEIDIPARRKTKKSVSPVAASGPDRMFSVWK